MTLSFTASPYYILLIIVLAGALSYLMYRGTQEILPRRILLLLSAFRFLVIAFIGTLLLQPLLSTLNKVSYAPIIAVLQDVSESLVIQKDSSFVKDEYPQLLKNFVSAFQGDEYALEVFGYAADLENELDLDSLSFDQTGTNISQAINEVQQRYQNQNLAALVLVSDGISTAGTNPLYAIEGIQQPIYTVLLGDTTTQQDVQIKEVLFNEIAYLNNEMPIKVKIKTSGYEQADLKVSLRTTDKVLDTQPLKLRQNQPSGELSFLIKPETVGLQQYEIRVTRLNNEITYRNNVRRIFVNVLENRVKVALFGGSAHPDIGALRQAMDRDERYELQEFILERPGKYYESPANYKLSDFDLFILHNFPNSSADRQLVQQLLTEIKERKAPVMFLVGKFTDLRSMQPLFPYMGITPRNYNLRSEEITVNFSPAYAQHSTFTFSENWLSWANESPPIYRNRSNWEPKSTTEVFATAKIKNIALDYPVYGLQSHLGRKNVVFLGENFWRMRAHSYREFEDFDFFDDWLFNNIKWLRVQDDKRRFKVEPAKRIFSGNETVIFTGQAYDDSYNPIPGVEIRLNLRSPDGKDNDYYLNEVNDTQYFLELDKLSEGTYSYQAEGRKDGRSIGTDRGQFSVGKSNVEHFQLQADKDLLQQIALRTQGTFIYARDLSELPEKLKALDTLVPISDFKRQKTEFFEFWWILAALLSLMGVEWVVRKLYSLV